MVAERIKLCIVCGREFKPMANSQMYCSYECKKKRRMERERERNLNNKKKKAAPFPSIEEVMRFAVEYEKKHGRYIHYGEAVQLMEGGKIDG